MRDRVAGAADLGFLEIDFAAKPGRNPEVNRFARSRKGNACTPNYVHSFWLLG
jgi:hypothetical protein